MDPMSDLKFLFESESCCEQTTHICKESDENKTSEGFPEERSALKMSSEQVRFTWAVEQFSARSQKSGKRLLSPVFSEGLDSKLSWYLCLYPAGRTEALQAHLSLYLYMVDNPSVDRAAVQYETSIVDARGKRVSTQSCSQVFSADDQSWGWDRFISRQRVLNKSTGLLVDDRLTFVFTVNAKFTSKDSTLLPKKVDAVEAAAVRTPADEASRLVQDLGGLLETLQFHDVTLQIGKSTFPAHRNILAARSTVFRAMFEHQMKERKEGRVNINNVKPEVMREMLRYIYTGTVKQLEKLADKLLAVADKYDLQGLFAICEDQLGCDLSAENAVDTLILADLHSAKRLKEETLDVLVWHSAEIVRGVTWSRLKKHPHLVLEVCEALALAS